MDHLLTKLRALADPTRLRIVLLIRQLELSVGEIVQILGQSQPRVSRHIRILDESGITERRKEGSWVFLRPGPELSDGSFDALFGDLSGGNAGMADNDIARLEEVRAERAKMAEEYFANHADEWDSLRSMHIAESEVEDAMRRVLDTAPIGKVLDIGTGTGRMIELFAGEADRFTALDNNSEMLRIARAKLGGLVPGELDQERVEIMLGDFNALPLPDSSFDTVIFHQVLHYAQNPEAVIAEAARVLRPGGRMMIVDFAAHDREELRSVHAHARLGFSDKLISRAFSAAGIRLAHELSLAGGELAVKIWLGRDTRESIAPNETREPKTPKLRNVA